MLFAEALAAILSIDGRIEVVGRAANGETAVQLARELQPDVVVMDLSMPRGDGFDATRQIREAASVHVLLSAALVGLILMHSGRDAGLGGMGFTPASQGGTHIVERNLTRLTVVIALLFFANTVALYRLLA